MCSAGDGLQDGTATAALLRVVGCVDLVLKAVDEEGVFLVTPRIKRLSDGHDTNTVSLQSEERKQSLWNELEPKITDQDTQKVIPQKQQQHARTRAHTHAHAHAHASTHAFKYDQTKQRTNFRHRCLRPCNDQINMLHKNVRPCLRDFQTSLSNKLER